MLVNLRCFIQVSVNTRFSIPCRLTPTYSVPCDIIEDYAPTLTFGGHPFTVSGDTFNLGPLEVGSSDCLAGIAGSEDLGKFFWTWITCSALIQAYYIRLLDRGRCVLAERVLDL
jgi:hypothetical protein